MTLLSRMISAWRQRKADDRIEADFDRTRTTDWNAR